MELNHEPSWIDLIVTYKSKTEARALRLRVTSYSIYDDKLYWRGYSMPFLMCVAPLEVEYIMREIHQALCGNHAKGQFVAFKTL